MQTLTKTVLYTDTDGVAKFREEAVAATRQLAKRQLTWFRGELDLRWFDPHLSKAELESALSFFITR